MSIQLSDRVKAIKPSPTLALTSKVLELKAQGVDVISLSAGEPDFDTADFIKDAAHKAIDEGKTKYTQVDGTTELKEAICLKLKNENHLDYSTDQILVSSGAKHSLYNLFQAVLNPGDEVIILAPYWVSYPAMATLAEAKSVFVTPPKGTLKVQAEDIENAITEKTRLLVLNSPSNPSGLIYSKEELKAIADVLLKHPQVCIVSDDIYEHIRWEGDFDNIINASPELYDRTVVINGVSKAYAMTGWRIGYAAGHPDIIKAMKKIQSQSTSNAASISQAASIVALTGSQSHLREMVKAYKERHDFLVKRLNKIDGLSFEGGNGAFYAFVNCDGAIAKRGLEDDIQLADFLLDEGKVATVPGTAFGMPGYLRLSYATSMSVLEQACDRIEQALSH